MTRNKKIRKFNFTGLEYFVKKNYANKFWDNFQKKNQIFELVKIKLRLKEIITCLFLCIYP